MRTIPQITQDIINRKPFLLELMAKDLINLTALARSIKNDVEIITKENVTIGSILMALKRYVDKINVQAQKLEESVNSINNVMLISNLTEYTFTNVEHEEVKQSDLSKIRSVDNRAFLSYIKGVYELTIIIDSKHETEVDKIYKTDKLIGKTTNMSALIIQLPPNNESTSGLYYYIFKQLAWIGIPISEVVSTQNELILIIQESLVEQAFMLVQALKTKKYENQHV
ncbi:MAG: hypothetical protein KAG96_02140 [Ichthyobacteriaceae bacterium]|nr:hypothetical protein [Ichthyobacteriaceae bacterium]